MTTSTEPRDSKRTRRPIIRRSRPGELPIIFGLPAIVIGLLFTAGPIAIIVIYSFLTQPSFGGGISWVFSVQAYIRTVFVTDFLGRVTFDHNIAGVFVTSFQMAALTAIICLVMAFPLALWMSTRKPRTQKLLVVLITVPFWTSILVRSYALVLLFGNNGPINEALAAVGLNRAVLLYTPFATEVGLIYTFFPFMVLPLYSALETFDFRLAEAAYDLGARKLTVIRRVIYPAAKGGIIAGLLLVFIPALGSYIQPELLGGGKVLLLGNLIAQQFGTGRNWPLGAALSVLTLLLMLLAFLALMLWRARAAKKLRSRA